MSLIDLFFQLPLKSRPLLLDSEYYPRVVDTAPKPVARVASEPHKLPPDWQIGDPI